MLHHNEKKNEKFYVLGFENVHGGISLDIIMDM